MWSKIWSGIKIGFEWFLKGFEGADYWDGYLGVPVHFQEPHNEKVSETVKPVLQDNVFELRPK